MEMQATGQKGGLKAKVQRLGSHLSGMVMPNIGGFIVGCYHCFIYSRWVYSK